MGKNEIKIPKAVRGHNEHGAVVFVPFSGRLTHRKSKSIFRRLSALRVAYGWVVKNLVVQHEDEFGLSSWSADGEGGRSFVTVLEEQ